MKKAPEYPIQEVAFFSLSNGDKQVLVRTNFRFDSASRKMPSLLVRKV